jgi:hypothetical protein
MTVKKMRLMMVVSSVLFSFSAHAIMQIECTEGENRVQLNTLLDGTYSLSVNGVVNALTKALKLDPYSKSTQHDLYSNYPVELAQDRYSSNLVFSVPHNAISFQPGETYQGQLQYRDYDDDYYDLDGVDKGPLSNGYALGSDSLLNLTCNTIGN